MLGQLLALMVLLPTPPPPACALDIHGIRDVYAPPDAPLPSETMRAFRTRQMWTLRRLVMLNPKRYDGNARLKLAFHYLDEGEAARISGKNSTVWGRRARHVLRQLYALWPQHAHRWLSWTR